MMGLTIDILRGESTVYVTCDCCGWPILGTPAIEPPRSSSESPAGQGRDYERYSHQDGECPQTAEPEPE